HGVVLVFGAALESGFAPAEQAQLVKTGPAVAKRLAQKHHVQCYVVAVDRLIADRFLHLREEFRGKGFVGIEQQDPLKCKWKNVQCPLTLFGTASAVVKLDDVGAERLCNGYRIVGALRISDKNLSNPSQRSQTTRQICGLVSHRDNHAYRKRHTTTQASLRW